jgi:diacylglycerol kinase family enzyme
VAKAARNLKDRTTPVAILPMGTANNVARSLGLTAPPQELAAKLTSAPARALNIGSAQGPWGQRGFVEAVGFGAVAEAIANAGPKPDFEHRIRLGREGLSQTIAKAKPHDFRMRIDGQTLEGSFLFVEALNLCFSGPRLPFAHKAEAGDGILDVLFLTEEDREPVLDWIAESPELEPPPLRLVQGRRVEIEWTDAPLRIDDRVYEPTKKSAGTINIGIDGESFGVLCPGVNAPDAMAHERD